MSLDSLAALKPYLSFFHPIAMWILLVVALYAMYLGVRVRQTRMADGDLKKALVKGQFAIRHHQMGSILLVLMVMGAIGGITVTYLNNGQIVVGPHLVVGLGMVGLVSASVALVPFMLKQDWVRSIHMLLTPVKGLAKKPHTTDEPDNAQ